MNLIHHVRPGLLLSCRYPAAKTSYSATAKPCRRTFTLRSMLDELDNTPSAEEHTATEAIPKSESTLHSDHPPKRIILRGRLPKPSGTKKSPPPPDGDSKSLTFSQKLRLRAAERRATEKKKRYAGTRDAVLAAEGAISRDHANQDDILQTLHQAIVFDKRPKGMKKAKKKTSTVDTSTLFQALKSEQPPEIPPVKVGRQGWKADEWLNGGWGKDGLAPSAAKLKHVPKKPRARRARQRAPPYTRRIEGLLQTTEKPVLESIAPPREQKPIAQLAHGLDRVLFNPGVHWLQDPRSGVYNFTTWLESIPNVKDFAFDRVTGFVRSSSDDDLWTLAKREGRRYTGSTSSLTGMLCHIYFLISNYREVDTSSLSQHFQFESKEFTAGQRMPSTVNMNYKDGIYAFDSASSDLSEMNVLAWMGTMLEKFLTVPQDEFNRYLRDAPKFTEEEIDTRREAYRYSKSERFVMRSQLDGFDDRLPGTGVFDIKTRAALPIRMDLMNHEENSGYLIKTLQGPVESFEREYYDLIRSAFLKYSFQVRIGNMDGVIVAYHNTARLFGFQYIPLDEMDACLFGGVGRGDRVFQKCVGLLEEVADEIIRIFPEQSVRCTFETDERFCLHVWVEPLKWTGKACPIAQLDVKVVSYLDETLVRGPQAVSAMETPWVVHWSISRSSLSDSNIRLNLSKSKERQFRSWCLPTGVGFKEMQERWQNLKIGSNNLEYNSSYFRHPSKNVEQLRRLARSGRDETQRLANENAGKRKIVWGVPEEVEDRDMESQEFMEESTEDFTALNNEDGSSAVIVAGSEDLEGTELGNISQETILLSDDIEGVLDGSDVPRDQDISQDAEPTTKPQLEVAEAEGAISDELPAIEAGSPEISTSEVAAQPSTVSMTQLVEDNGDEILNDVHTISDQGSQMTDIKSEPEEGGEKDKVTVL